MRALTIPIVATALVVAVMAYQAKTGEATLCVAPEVRLDAIEGFAVEDVPVGEAELTVLPADTGFVKRRYCNEAGEWFMVTAVIGGKSKNSVHRPELCLPSQGFQMSDPRTVEVDGVEWRLVSLARREASAMGFAYTFYNQDGFRTASHFRRIFRDIWDRSMHGRIDRWVMVTVNSSTAEERVVTEFLGRLKGMMK